MKILLRLSQKIDKNLLKREMREIFVNKEIREEKLKIMGEKDGNERKTMHKLSKNFYCDSVSTLLQFSTQLTQKQTVIQSNNKIPNKIKPKCTNKLKFVQNRVQESPCISITLTSICQFPISQKHSI